MAFAAVVVAAGVPAMGCQSLGLNHMFLIILLTYYLGFLSCHCVRIVLGVEVRISFSTCEVLNLILIIIIVSILLIYFLTERLVAFVPTDKHREPLVAVVSLCLVLGGLRFLVDLPEDIRNIRRLALTIAAFANDDLMRGENTLGHLASDALAQGSIYIWIVDSCFHSLHLHLVKFVGVSSPHFRLVLGQQMSEPFRSLLL